MRNILSPRPSTKLARMRFMAATTWPVAMSCVRSWSFIERTPSGHMCLCCARRFLLLNGIDRLFDNPCGAFQRQDTVSRRMTRDKFRERETRLLVIMAQLKQEIVDPLLQCVMVDRRVARCDGDEHA